MIDIGRFLTQLLHAPQQSPNLVQAPFFLNFNFNSNILYQDRAINRDVHRFRDLDASDEEQEIYECPRDFLIEDLFEGLKVYCELGWHFLGLCVGVGEFFPSVQHERDYATYVIAYSFIYIPRSLLILFLSKCKQTLLDMASQQLTPPTPTFLVIRFLKFLKLIDPPFHNGESLLSQYLILIGRQVHNIAPFTILFIQVSHYFVEIFHQKRVCHCLFVCGTNEGYQIAWGYQAVCVLVHNDEDQGQHLVCRVLADFLDILAHGSIVLDVLGIQKSSNPILPIPLRDDLLKILSVNPQRALQSLLTINTQPIEQFILVKIAMKLFHAHRMQFLSLALGLGLGTLALLFLGQDSLCYCVRMSLCLVQGLDFMHLAFAGLFGQAFLRLLEVEQLFCFHGLTAVTRAN